MNTIVDKEVVSVLNDLIETAKDGEYGFATCAERVKSSSIKETLQRRSADCRLAADELRALVVQFGGEPEDGGSMLGAMHRGWVSVKDAISVHSDRAVLEEAERGEDHALARYRKALKAELPAHVRALVQRQFAGAQANHDQVKVLRDSTRT
jgi:uncharacterized protein (TIGR02284 family)